MAIVSILWRALLVGVILTVALIITGFIMGFAAPLLALVPLTGILLTIVNFVVYVVVLGFVALFVLKFIGVHAMPRWLDVRAMKAGAYTWH